MEKSEKILSCDLRLGEGPLWSAKEQCLYLVDIEGKRICKFFPCIKKIQINNADNMPGCIVLDEKGNLIAAEKNKLILMDNALNTKRTLLKIKSIKDNFRFNDGKCDSKGRLWIGTMAINQQDKDAVNGGALYRIESDGTIKIMERDLTIPNGLAWNRDNTVFYHTDSYKGEIYSYDFDLEKGEISNKRLIIKISSMEQSRCV